MKKLGIGVLGFGTVGAGVVEGLLNNGELLASRLGVEVELRGIADLDIESDRGVDVPDGLLTTDAEALVDREDVDVVVELIGGTGVALSLVKRALRAGKPVVTANKKLLAEYGREIYAMASEHGADLYFGASVGGGIPIVRALREGLAANRILSMCGILNGTCNYILTRMEQEGLAFDPVLEEAQRLGFAEADPALDVDGYDTAHKAVILASMAYGLPVSLDAVHVEGIRGLARTDVDYAAELGYRIKLLAVVKNDGDEIEVSVGPTLVPLDSMLASVSGVFNAVMVKSDLADETLYYGRGAGRAPTASTVLGDVADAARNLAKDALQRVPVLPLTGERSRVKPMDAVISCHYLRLSVQDTPGVLGRIASVLGDTEISIEAVIQKPSRADGTAPLVILTHQAREADMTQALEQLKSMDVIIGNPVHLRVVSP